MRSDSYSNPDNVGECLGSGAVFRPILGRLMTAVIPAVLAVGLVFGPAQGEEAGDELDLKTAVATFNGGEITVSEFQEGLRAAAEKYGPSYDMMKYKNEILVSMATQEILGLEAREQGYVDELGVRDPDIIASKEKVMLNTLRRDVILAGVQVSEEEIRALYDLGETRRLTRTILLGNKEEAELVHKELASGADFIELAEEWSLDLGSAAWKGLMAWVQPGVLGQETEEFIYGLPLGEASRPLETPKGYYIFRVDSIYHAAQEPYEELRGKLRSAVRRRTYTPIYNAYMDSVARARDVKYEYDTIDLVVERFAEEGWVDNPKPGRKSRIPTFSPEELALPVASLRDGSLPLGEYLAFVKDTRINPAIYLAGREEVERGMRGFVGDVLALRVAYELGMDKVQAVIGHVREKATAKGVTEMLVEAAGGEESARATEEDRRAFYEENASLYTEPGSVVISMVTILEEESVIDLHEDAKSGKPFSEIATNYRWILDEERTGERVELTHKDEDPTIFEVTRRMKVGAVSEPIPMPDGGYTVVKLLEKRPGRILPYEEVRKEVAVDLNMKILGIASNLIEEFKKNLREKYNYRVNNEAFEAVTL